MTKKISEMIDDLSALLSKLEALSKMMDVVNEAVFHSERDSFYDTYDLISDIVRTVEVDAQMMLEEIGGLLREEQEKAS